MPPKKANFFLVAMRINKSHTVYIYIHQMDVIAVSNITSLNVGLLTLKLSKQESLCSRNSALYNAKGYNILILD